MTQKKDAMPVLEFVAEKAGACSAAALADTVVLHINHCMENSFYFSQLLDRLFARAVFIGVPYNDMEVEDDWSFLYYYGKRRKSYGAAQEFYELWDRERCICSHVAGFLEATQALIELALEKAVVPYLKEGKKLLIMEDGGYHYPVMHRFLEAHPQWKAQVRGCVEQTASGTIRGMKHGKAYGFQYPCISISRSDIKMYIESRFIGHRVVEELADFLYSANAFLDFHQVLLLGYGIVGRQVAQDLGSRGCKLSVYDTDDRIAETAKQDGCFVVASADRSLFEKDTIVIGNTGADAFTNDMFQAFLDGKGKLYLASSSSQDIEFQSFLNMISGKAQLPDGACLETWESQEFYSRYGFQYEGRSREVYLIAEGLPVNFYRKGGVSLTYSVIELIFAEMLSAGLALLGKESFDQNMWLLGDKEAPFSLFFSEEELAGWWFEQYGLTGCKDFKELPGAHPEAEYLREYMWDKGTVHAE